MARYRTVLFDADNTLLDFMRSEREALTDTLLKMGVTPDENMIATYSRINDANWRRLERGEITKTELRVNRFAEFCDCYGWSFDAAAMAEAYTNALGTKRFLMAGALEVCRTLSKDCRLYIITNGIASVQHGRFDSSPLAPLFTGAFISDEMGCEKPSKAFFDIVAANIPDFDPATTLVVGDSLTSDIAGGIGAGLDTCWFNTKKSAVPEQMPITYVVEKLEEILPLVLGA